MSGLVAAKKLQDLSSASSTTTTVIVLEARDRLGGRIHTLETKEAGPVDVGAAWIHGHSNKNPISQLVKQINKQDEATKKEKIRLFKQNWDSMKAYDTEGSTAQVISNRKVFRAFKQHDKLIKKAQNLLKDESGDVSLAEAIQKIQPEALQDPVMGWILAIMEEGDYGGSLEDLSTLRFDNDEVFPGHDALVFTGYKNLIDFVATGLDIRTNVQVESIQYDSTTRVQIETTQGTFSAKYCIMTVPLGVLKANTIQFQPPLPLPKQDAIKNVGFGTTAKVVLVFEKAFWPLKTQVFANVSKSRTVAQERGKFPTLINLYPATGNPVLVAYAEGKYVMEEMNKYDDETIIRQVMDTVKIIFGKESTPEPIESFVTRWGTDPYSRGTYSYHATGQGNREWYELSKSVDNVLYFAGEHCSKRYRGTVHGAYLSGERAADELHEQIMNET